MSKCCFTRYRRDHWRSSKLKRDVKIIIKYVFCKSLEDSNKNKVGVAFYIGLEKVDGETTDEENLIISEISVVWINLFNVAFLSLLIVI